MKKSIKVGDVITEIAFTGLLKVPIIGAVGLMAISYGSCGAFALCLASALYFIKVFKLYEDYLESFVISLIPGVRESNSHDSKGQMSSINIHFSLMMLTFTTALMNLPTMVSWVKAMQ